MKKQENYIEEGYKRICPKCNKEVINKDKYQCIRFIKDNKLCGLCSRQELGLRNKGIIRTDKDKNIVIEYNEKYHYSPKMIDLDKIRRELIIEYLNCKFIVINYKKEIKIYE